MAHSIAQAHPFQGFSCNAPPLPCLHPGIYEGNLYICKYRFPREKIELLKHEPDPLVADMGQACIVKARHVLSTQEIPAGRGPVETADYVHER